METLEREAWLASLRPGDKVAVECNYHPEYGYDYTVQIIEEMTSDGHIGLVGGTMYKPDGTQMEKSLWSQWGWGDPCYKLVQITPTIEASMKRWKLIDSKYEE